MRFAVVALAFLGTAGAAFAGGPVKLTDAQMDIVRAGNAPVPHLHFEVLPGSSITSATVALQTLKSTNKNMTPTGS